MISESQICSWDRVIFLFNYCVTVIQYITVSVGHVTCCLYFGSSRERFALLKSPRMIKRESVFQICVRPAVAWRAHARVWRLVHIHQKERGKLSGRVERFMKSASKLGEHIFFRVVTSEHSPTTSVFPR